jgi:hypothetical protein
MTQSGHRLYVADVAMTQSGHAKPFKGPIWSASIRLKRTRGEPTIFLALLVCGDWKV